MREAAIAALREMCGKCKWVEGATPVAGKHI